ncbi:MAG: anthranilate synthase component I [Verrucomicrobia bacterium Tous-C9LFEB]|nr:MAG: anthranilate synthase component I [Verrucomicrobia bacterium Tous-C9LFEB]
MISPNRDEFFALAKKGNLIPVSREIMADLETPVSAYLKIDTGDHSFLLESVERGGRFARYSFLGASPGIIFTAREGQVTITENGQTRTFQSDTDPLSELQKLMGRFKPVESEHLPLFSGGAVGYLSYEAVTYFEKTVPRAKLDDLHIPDAYFVISDTLLIFDHLEHRIKIVANAYVEGDAGKAYDEAVRKIDELTERLKRSVSHKVLSARANVAELKPSVNITQAEYISMTESMQEYIKSGDIFQVVPSQRFEVPFESDPVDLYRSLRLINPSPYMFCLKFNGMAVVGASPEVHVRCVDGKVEIRPIAGTRPRRENEAEDNAMAEELLADPKERAEHVMLVDLARNDVGRVCDYNTVKVTDLMIIERYSHVMHIVSNVEGHLKPEQNAYDVMRATFPAGTVSGSPKVRAMQIIAEKEKTCRGTYAGAVGYFGFNGNLDSCIAIRTVLIKDGRAYLQAGGGLVADSTPMGEYNESVNKAKAGMKGLAMAKGVK